MNISDNNMELRLSLIRSPHYPDTINVDEIYKIILVNHEELN